MPVGEIDPWPIIAFAHDRDPDAGTLVDGLHDIGRLYHVPRQHVGKAMHGPFRAADADGAQQPFGQRLVHGDRRRRHARMGVGDAQMLQNTLDDAVLAAASVQRIEGDVRGRRQRVDQPTQIVVHIDRRDLEPALAQCVRSRGAGNQRHLAFGGPAAHQHRDLLSHRQPPARAGACRCGGFPSAARCRRPCAPAGAPVRPAPPDPRPSPCRY